MKKNALKSGFLYFFFFIFLIHFSTNAFARKSNNSVMEFRPSMDGGKYLTTEQSQGLYQWGYHLGATTYYAFEPVEIVLSGAGTTRLSGVVDDLVVTHLTGAFGLTDWLNIGVDYPLVAYETFFNFINTDASLCTVGGVCPKQTRKLKSGDLKVAAKIRILDLDRSPVGLALEPFFLFPTGSGYFVTGYGQYSGGGKLILDVNIHDAVYLSLNAGYQVLKETRYVSSTPSAKINDQILFSGGIHIPIGHDWGIIGEMFGRTLAETPFKHIIQSPVEALVAARFSPGFIKRWQFTAGAGAGMDRGFGAPGYRLLAQAEYRHANVVELEEETPDVVEADFEEKIIITQKIHFEFDRSVIRPISFPILDDVVTVLHENIQIKKVEVGGHTDSVGSDAYNNKLSLTRANAVRNYLISKGVSPDRLSAHGYGETQPIGDNETALGRAKNRRTEFTVVKD